MTKTIIKSVVLVGLVALSVYQIAMLWFDYPSDRNFFYSIIDAENNLTVAEEEKDYKVFEPVQVAIYPGTSGSNYLMYDLDGDEFGMVSNSVAIMRLALGSGFYVEDYMSNEELYISNHIMVQFPFTVSEAMVKSDLGVYASWLEEEQAFERMYVYPGELTDDYMMVVFTDNALESKWTVRIPVGNVNELNTAVNELIIRDVTEEDDLFISTKQKGFETFYNDLILPINGADYNNLMELYGDRYFFNGDERDDEAIEDYIKYFLINPEIAWSTENSNEIRFGDLEVVASYTGDGLFSYRLIEEFSGKETRLNSAYSAVVKFLEKDKILNQVEYELVDYDQDETGMTFYYEYSYLGMPIVFHNLEKDYGISHPMEVKVVGNTVISYKRVLWKMQEMLVQGNPFEVRYQQPWDSILEEFGDGVTITDMYLGYYSDGLGEEAGLRWIVEMPSGRRLYELE